MSRKKSGFSPDDPEFEQPPEVRVKGSETARAASGASEAFVIGQRWASDMEPELGIGTVTRMEPKRLTLSFQGGACVREYSKASPPLRRIRFKKGDSVLDRHGTAITIESIGEKDDLLIYQSKDRSIPEIDLSDSIRFTAPLDRLLAGHRDTLGDFRLRRRALDLRNRLDKSPVHGFCGARIDLIPHQLYIADEAASMHVRRILLADEVGLGKTIEACLILRKLLVCGRAVRALVCVPQSIVHVWFVELLRKFNLIFKIIDADAKHIGSSPEIGKNVFLDDQLVLCDIGFLSSDLAAARQAAEAGWDVLIIDEAHHLREEGTPLFDLVKALSVRSRDVFLLTATPRQHGERNHFARLRLLDPSRYSDFDAFVNESRTHHAVAAMTGRLLDGKDLDNADKEFLAGLRGAESIVAAHTGSPAARQRIVAELLDRFGVGRAMFRNTRDMVGGFSKRVVDILSLNAPAAGRDDVCGESCDMVLPPPDDPRFVCLTEILRKFENEKFLLICQHKETAKAIEKALRRHVKVNIALFHEDLTLIQRDRNAAWFGEEEGAHVLICSEIGSEGRNFQFCRHLFLWDLPHDCELIEQRIGRLDRIGQKREVIIHVPFISGTSSEVMCSFCHEGLGIFQSAVPAAQEVFETMEKAVVSLSRRASPRDGSWRPELDGLVLDARRLTNEVSRRLESGRDRLLELRSYHPRRANEIVRLIREADNDRSLEQFMMDLFLFHGVFAEPLDKRTYKLWSESPLDESFPALHASRPLVTFDRAYGLAREDIEFMTADHPAVRNGLDMFIGSEKGNCCFVRRQGSGTGRGLLLDAVFVVDCVALPELQVERFLPPTPVRVVVDHTLRDRPDISDAPDFERSLQECEDPSVLDNSDLRTVHLPAMLNRAAECARQAACGIIGAAMTEMNTVVGAEERRITALAKINTHIPIAEIDAIRNEILRLEKAISGASPRLDSIRLILTVVD